MTLFVDTSAWSLTLRRDTAAPAPVVTALVEALGQGVEIVTTGLVLQEILQGFSGPRFREAIIERFATVPLIVPDRRDHVEAAELRNRQTFWLPAIGDCNYRRHHHFYRAHLAGGANFLRQYRNCP